MNKEEIFNGLESHVARECNACPYVSRGDCYQVMMGNLLELLKEQEKRISKLEDYVDYLKCSAI